MRLVFAGTPEFAAQALRGLLVAGHAVALVLTQPDRPAGRGLKLLPSPVKLLAQASGIPVAQPRSLRLDGRYPDDAAAAQAALVAAAPELMVVAAYGLILPAWTLALPARGCWNIHASLLPRWRGAAPIQRAIEAGDAETGITLMQMDAGLDTGAMLVSASLAIAPDDTSATLLARLSALGGELVVRGLAGPALSPIAQPKQGVSYAHKVEKSEALIAWHAPAEQIERRVRAFDPFPGASFVLDGETVKLWRASVVPDMHSAAPGQVLRANASEVVVACGQDALALHTVQRPGGRRIDVAAWLQSTPGLRGRLLGGASAAVVPTHAA